MYPAHQPLDRPARADPGLRPTCHGRTRVRSRSLFEARAPARNTVTLSLPKIGLSLWSARISRRFLAGRANTTPERDPGSQHRLPARHRHYRAGNIARLVRCEQHEDRCHLLRLARARQRALLAEARSSARDRRVHPLPRPGLRERSLAAPTSSALGENAGERPIQLDALPTPRWPQAHRRARRQRDRPDLQPRHVGQGAGAYRYRHDRTTSPSLRWLPAWSS